jgi:hypothetical protein
MLKTSFFLYDSMDFRAPQGFAKNSLCHSKPHPDLRKKSPEISMISGLLNGGA